MTRNLEMLEKLAVALENSESFNMKSFRSFSPDGHAIPGCIMSHASNMVDPTKFDSSDAVGLAFGILNEDYIKFSFPDDNEGKGIWDIDRDQAARVVRHYAKTGEVNHLVTA